MIKLKNQLAIIFGLMIKKMKVFYFDEHLYNGGVTILYFIFDFFCGDCTSIKKRAHVACIQIHISGNMI